MFESLSTLPLDPIFKLQAEYVNCKNPKKINLGIGLYADQKGCPVVLPSIKKAFSKVDKDDFNYQPLQGNLEFLKLVQQVILPQFQFEELAMQATCGGTQAIRIFADLVYKETDTMIVGVPTWSNHLAICKNFNIVTYNHLNSDGLASFVNLEKTLETCSSGSFLLIHSGKTHNPSGQNLSINEWLKLAELINKKQIKVLIDTAYFGFGDNFDTEQKFLNSLFTAFDNVACALSFSKNASLYEHRTGVVIVKTQNKIAVESQMQQLMRESVSMAPGLGQELLITVFKELRSDWINELEQIKSDLDSRRSKFVALLPNKFSYIRQARGMFALLPLTPSEIEEIKVKHSIFLSTNGRINVAGITSDNLDYLTEVLKKK